MFQNSYFKLIATILLIGFSPAATNADLVWSDFLSDEQEITNGMTFATTENVVTVGATVTENNTGDFSPFASSTIFSFEGDGLQGNQSQFIEMSFDQASNDPNDFLEFSLVFETAVQNLQFSVLDIDEGAASVIGLPPLITIGSPVFVDLVEVFVNGTNIKNDPALYSLGSALVLDDEAEADGFEGDDEVDTSSTNGNLDLDFGLLEVESIRISYRSSDDAALDPSGQIAGVSNLSFNTVAVPEPGAFSMLMLLSTGLMAPRRRMHSSYQQN